MGTVHPVNEQVCLYSQLRRLPFEYSPPQYRGGLFLALSCSEKGLVGLKKLTADSSIDGQNPRD